MAHQYYCLIAGLPDLNIADKKLSVSLADLREDLLHELAPTDRELVKLWFLPHDHFNIANVLYNRQFTFDSRGIFSRSEVEILTDRKNQDETPAVATYDYIRQSINEVIHSEDVISQSQFESQLLSGYFQILWNHGNPFVRQYGMFESNIRNIFAALNGRKYGLKFEQQLIGEGDVIEALKRSRARDFGLSAEIENIESLVQIFEIEDVMERELKIDTMRWQFLEEATFFNYFTIEKVMAYLLKLMIVERWLALDEEKGRMLFQQLLSDLKSGYVVPEEYKLSYGKK